MTNRDETTIRTHVTFTGAQPYLAADDDESEADETYGEALLRRIGDRLRRDGLDADEVIQEALGASIEVGAGDETFRISADHRGDDWHLHFAPEGAADLETLSGLLVRTDRILKRLPGIRNVTWHLSDDWDKAHEDRGAAKPITEPSSGQRTGRHRPVST